MAASAEAFALVLPGPDVLGLRGTVLETGRRSRGVLAVSMNAAPKQTLIYYDPHYGHSQKGPVVIKNTPHRLG